MSNESVDDDEQQFRAFATQTEPAYLTYVTFAGNTISLLGQLVYISLSARLLFFAFFRRRRLRVDSLSTSMLIYLFTDLTCSTLGLVDGFYMVLMWRPSGNNFNMRFVFWNGAILVNYVTVAPVPVFFLTLDRCLALRLSHQLNERLRHTMNMLSVCVIVCVYLGSFAFFVLELPIPEWRYKDCLIFACLIQRFRTLPQLIIRLTFAVMNLMCTFYFLRLLRTTKKSNIKDRVVKITVVIDMCLTITPTVFGTLCSAIYGKSSANYIGPYSMYVNVEAAICAITYTAVLVRRRHAAGDEVDDRNSVSFVSTSGRVHPPRRYNNGNNLAVVHFGSTVSMGRLSDRYGKRSDRNGLNSARYSGMVSISAHK